LEQSNEENHEALFVGDRQSDYQARLAAGIEGRILKRSFNERYWYAGPMVSSLLSILPLLDALEPQLQLNNK